MMLRVTLKRSVIGYNKRQRQTAKALGLGKVGSSYLHARSDSVMGTDPQDRSTCSMSGRVLEPVEVGK